MIQVDSDLLQRALIVVEGGLYLEGMRPRDRAPFTHLQDALRHQRRDARRQERLTDQSPQTCAACGCRTDRCSECGEPTTAGISELTTEETT